MSTYIYLVCLDHSPPLMAEEESGQHLYDLPQIRADVADRQRIVDCYERGHIATGDNAYFLRNTARFLAQHTTCHIGIKDEYGGDHPVDTEPGKAT